MNRWTVTANILLRSESKPEVKRAGQMNTCNLKPDRVGGKE
jgi:hypothetical protein